MAQDPGMLIPDCAGECSRCPSEKLLARLRRIHAKREEPEALRKLASSGKQLERGYASMLILALEESPIMFATAKLPGQDVPYTVRGKARKEILIGLQHFDDARLRLLAYSEYAIGNKLHIYSGGEQLLCTGRKAMYPRELVSEVVTCAGYSLAATPDGIGCGHRDAGCLLRVRIVSAGITITLCRQCASAKQNMHAALASRVLCRRPDDDFDISLVHDIRCSKGGVCSVPERPRAAGELVKRYREGGISDRAVLEDYEAGVRKELERAGNTIYVLGDTCFEDDSEAFIAALGPTDPEAKALRRVLASSPGPVILSDPTPNAVLALFWESQGANAIHAVTGDKDLARKLFAENRDSGKPPAQILREAVASAKSREALAGLPEFGSLGRVGRYIDDIARAHRAQGRDEVIRRIGSSHRETKLKSIDCGFLAALGALKGREWQFTREELDYGAYLADFARALLESKPEGYADALQNLLTASGSGESAA
jgi:hypothetical protein